jgi:putative membrane protein
LSKAFLEKAASDDVKKYARQMVDEHTNADEELMQVASAKGVQLPTVQMHLKMVRDMSGSMMAGGKKAKM